MSGSCVLECFHFLVSEFFFFLNQHPKDLTWTQRQRPELPTVTLTLLESKHKARNFHQRRIASGWVWFEDVPLVEFMYLVLCSHAGCHEGLGSPLLCSCDVFSVLINSPVCWFWAGTLGLILFQILPICSLTLQLVTANTYIQPLDIYSGVEPVTILLKKTSSLVSLRNK